MKNADIGNMETTLLFFQCVSVINLHYKIKKNKSLDDKCTFLSLLSVQFLLCRL